MDVAELMSLLDLYPQHLHVILDDGTGIVAIETRPELETEVVVLKGYIQGGAKPL